MHSIRPFLVFIGMLLAGLVFTGIVASTMDARVVDQEQQREHKQGRL